MSKLLNCGFDVKITSGNISISPPNLPDVNPIKYQAWSVMLEMPKVVNVAELKIVLLTIYMEFIDRAIV